MVISAVVVWLWCGWFLVVVEAFALAAVKLFCQGGKTVGGAGVLLVWLEGLLGRSLGSGSSVEQGPKEERLQSFSSIRNRKTQVFNPPKSLCHVLLGIESIQRRG